MKFDLSKIQMSDSDVRRCVKLPEILSLELAEFIGIMVGDGHLRFSVGIQRTGKPLVRSDIVISGNKNEDSYVKYIIDLFYLLFNIKLHYVLDKRSEAIILRAHSKGIVQFLNKICEIPLNRKTEIAFIPDIIKNADNNKIKYYFLRGLADTDFTVTFQNRTGKGHNYPLIKANFKSKILIKDLEQLFKDLGFRCNIYCDVVRFDKRFGHNKISSIYLYGRDNFDKWISNIGFSNKKFLRKVEKWQMDGICPPRY